MLSYVVPLSQLCMVFIGLFFSFFATFFALILADSKLPRDAGRAYAVNGTLSIGKARGAGIVFISSFVFFSLLFVPISLEFLLYYALVITTMLSGFLDDRANSPWSEYRKAVIDLIIGFSGALTYVRFHGTTIKLLCLDLSFTLPTWLFILLTVILIWTAINVVNCTDGVDGLCGSLSVVSLLGFFAIFFITKKDSSLSSCILILISCIIAYLWFNASPSKMLMGDAGSRAIGMFLALLALNTGAVFLFIPFAIVFLFDGGLGLIKVTLLRFFKIKFLSKIRLPLHDHVRKNKGWSDTQTVFRFVILQMMVILITMGIVL